MYKLGHIPNIYCSVYELADFLEVKCILSDSNSFSVLSATKDVNLISDEELIDGVESEEDNISDSFTDALYEISDRKSRCRNNYPFDVIQSKVVIDPDWMNNPQHSVYIYLLLATRANMTIDKIQNSIDGTLLFEELSEKVAKSYFGERSEAILFGTGAGYNFKDKITNLLSALKVDGEFIAPEGGSGRQKDGAVDIVVWIPFADNRKDKFIGFGQCKTGTSWENSVSQLNPEHFIRSYTSNRSISIFNTLKLFFVAEAPGWKAELVNHGIILFDRCRIMDFLPQISDDDALLNRISIWTGAILKTYSNC